MGASGQWCLISGYHFDVTFSKDDGLVTLKQIKNTSVWKCYTLHIRDCEPLCTNLLQSHITKLILNSCYTRKMFKEREELILFNSRLQAGTTITKLNSFHYFYRAILDSLQNLSAAWQ